MLPGKVARSPGPAPSSWDGAAGRHGGPQVPSEAAASPAPLSLWAPRGLFKGDVVSAVGLERTPIKLRPPGLAPCCADTGTAVRWCGRSACPHSCGRPATWPPPLTPVKHEDREQVMQPLGGPGTDVVLGVQAEDAQHAHESPDDGELRHVLSEKHTSPPCRPRGRLPPAPPPAPPPNRPPLGGPASPAPREEHPFSRPPGEWAGQTLRLAGQGRVPGGGDARGAGRPSPSTRQQLREIADEAQHVGDGVQGPGQFLRLLRRGQPGQDDLEGTDARPPPPREAPAASRLPGLSHQLPRRAGHSAPGGRPRRDPPHHTRSRCHGHTGRNPPGRLGSGRCSCCPAGGSL